MANQQSRLNPQQPGSTTAPVKVTLKPFVEGSTDALGTMMLLQTYMKEDGFHCPACGAIIENADGAIAHMEVEINGALDKLAKGPK